MKRGREIESMDDMANCLMLLTKVGQQTADDQTKLDRVFSCKTCNKIFSSFQALGGHRASHKKPRLITSPSGDIINPLDQIPVSPKKPKTHECSICGLEFAIGQALGGHMRRHRAAASNDQGLMKKPRFDEKTNLSLDLNLAPCGTDHLELKLEKMAPSPVIYFFI